MLTIYRRHTKTCAKGYSQNFRVYQPQPLTKAEKLEKKRDPKLDDCECPIAAEGQLSIEGRITNRSTRTDDWRQAQAVAGDWEQWGQTTDPALTLKENSIEAAVNSYLTTKGPQGENLQGGLKQIKVLLQQRLLPYGRANGLKLMTDLDSLHVVTQFTESWTNLDPHSDEYGEVLGMSTRKNQIEALRSFFRYCTDRGWMAENFAIKIKFSVKTGKKVGLDREDDERLSAWMRKNADPYVYALYAVMRQTGLRISDASGLHADQFVPRSGGDGWAVSVMTQEKTHRDVYIPVSAPLAKTLRELPFKGENGGRRYWFWPGKGSIKTNKNNWSMRIKRAARAAAKEKPFKIVITPHTFRHTFAITLMNKGTDIKTVSRLLGHAATSVTEKHYAHANVGTMQALESAIDNAA